MKVRLKHKRPTFKKEQNNIDSGFDIAFDEDWELIVYSFLSQYNIYLYDVWEEMDACEFLDRLGGLKDCVLIDTIRVRTSSEKEAKNFTTRQKEERRKYKERIRMESMRTGIGEKQQEREMWALWYALTSRAKKG